MLRPIVAIFQAFAASRAAGSARVTILAGIGVIVLLAGISAMHLAFAAAVFFALAPALGAAGAAALAAVAVAAIAALWIALLYWIARHEARGRAALDAETAEGALLWGTVASAFLTGLVAGLERHDARAKSDRA